VRGGNRARPNLEQNEMIFLLTWTAFSIAVGLFAQVRRNRNAFGWGLLAFIISPVIAGVFCAILREKQPGITEQTLKHDFLTRTTPHPAFEDLPASEQARLRQFRADLAARSR
jgi:hypothetical protein